MEQLRASGVTPQQIQMMQDMGMDQPNGAMVAIMGVYGVAALAYLLWVRKYFWGPAAAPEAGLA